MIEFTNNIIHDFRPLICFSRPCRFGKSIAAHMLTAYYSKGCDSREIFSGLKIAGLLTFEDKENEVLQTEYVGFTENKFLQRIIIRFMFKAEDLSKLEIFL